MSISTNIYMQKNNKLRVKHHILSKSNAGNIISKKPRKGHDPWGNKRIWKLYKGYILGLVAILKCFWLFQPLLIIKRVTAL